MLVALAGLFVTSIVTAQLLSAKLAVLTLPLVGAVLYPTGTVAYAVTFFASDLVAELYGKRTARHVVNVGFAMNAVLLGIVWLAIAAPNSGAGLPQAQFAAVLGPSTNIVIGSLVAYLVSQHWDVTAFHWVRERTGVRHLWIRNVASTGSSQLLDTVVFTMLAFGVLPVITGTGTALPLAAAASTIVGQYVLKLGIAALDTPLVYAAVHTIESRTTIDRTATQPA